MARRIDILLVEDDQADAELALRALSRTAPGPSVQHAADAESALHALTALGLRPRLVLLDLKLPGMSGLDFLQALRAGPPTRLLPVVVFTSSAEPKDLAGSYGLGANAYAQKPVDFDAFGDTLRRVCDFWLAVNRTHEPSH
jgi:CheY-like chemotaxis protein